MSKKYNLLFILTFFIYVLGSLFLGLSNGYESEVMFHRLSSLGKLGSCYILCVGVFHLFVERVNSSNNLLSLLFAIFFTEVEFFEGFLYQFLSHNLNINLGNSQYPKLILFLITFILLMVKFVTKRKNFAQFFNIVGMAIIIITTIIFHKIIVKESYIEMRDLHYKKVNLYQYLPDNNLFLICRNEKLTCFTWDADKNIKDLVGETKLASNLSEFMSKQEMEEGVLVYERQFNFDDAEENLDLENVLVMRQVSNKSFRFVFDVLGPNLIRDKFFKLFYILSAFAHLFWSLFMFYLILLHYNRNFCFKKIVLR